MNPLDDLLSALANPVRRSALAILEADGEKCLCELMEALGVRQSGMSRHMAVLKRAGLVVDRRDAQWVRYSPAALDGPAAAVVTAVLAADAVAGALADHALPEGARA